MNINQEIMNTSFNLKAEIKPPHVIWDLKLLEEGWGGILSNWSSGLKDLKHRILKKLFSN